MENGNEGDNAEIVAKSIADQLRADVEVAIDIYHDLVRLIRNYKKDSNERKTEQYLKSKRELFKKTYNEFTSVDKRAIEEPKYAKENYKKIIVDALEEIISDIKERLEFIKTNSSDFDLTTKEFSFKLSEELSDNAELVKLVKMQETLFKNMQFMIIDIEKQFDSMNLEMCDIKINRLEKTFERAENIDLQIWSICDEEHTPMGYSHHEFYCMSAKVEETINVLKTKINSTKNEAKAEIPPRRQKDIKLPDLTILPFDGEDETMWIPFKESYEECVGKQNLSTIRKFFYLKESLSGAARSLISDLEGTANNFQIAWDILENRYNNQRSIVNAHLDKILDYQPLVKPTVHGLKGLHDTSKKSIQALERMGINIENWDPIMHNIVFKKLDTQTRIDYVMSLDHPNELQSFKDFLSYIEQRFQALNCVGEKLPKLHIDIRQRSFITTEAKLDYSCPIGCKDQHNLHSCSKFQELKPNDRYQQAKDNNLCLNCLRKGHRVASCRSGNCLKCNAKHHTLLHMDKLNIKEIQNNAKIEEIKESALTTSSHSECNYTLLATAYVWVIGKNNKRILCRVLLDGGSQINCISESLAKKLGLNGGDSKLIEGFGQSITKVKKGGIISIESNSTAFQTDIFVNITPGKITRNHPLIPIDISQWNIPEHIQLADEKFNHPDRIDLMLGAAIASKINLFGKIQLKDNGPIMQNTEFGWIVWGELDESDNNYYSGITSCDPKCCMEKLWEIEEINEPKPKAKQELKWLKFFKDTTTIDKNGRIVVRLPFKTTPTTLGASRDQAIKRLISMEHRLSKSPEIKLMYNDFMTDYANLGHMEEVSFKDIPQYHYFIPHHYVQKLDSSTTKLRVVFDATAKSSTNLALNDVLHPGPKVQNEIFDILLRFRKYRYVFSGDIEKMFRQIMVHQDDQWFQLIVWRWNRKEAVKYFKLKTVTYGTSCAPYLAISALHKIADSSSSDSELKRTIKEDFYMDDVISGGNNLEEVIQMQSNLKTTLLKNGLNIRKWSSNHQSLLKFKPEEVETPLDLCKGETVKTLGIYWTPSTDHFSYKINQGRTDLLTKREVLSQIAKLFDPLGLLSPIVVSAKIIIQDIWRLNVEWDDTLPEPLVMKWECFLQELNAIDKLKIPRKVLVKNPAVIELHGFCDASLKAYGAVIYLRSKSSNKKVEVNLLCSKSRISPIRAMSITRLELCSALLLSILTKNVLTALQLPIDNINLYSDSSTVLQWLKMDSCRLEPFVAHRTYKILNNVEMASWRYIRTKHNPADIVSRGSQPKFIIGNKK